MNLPILNPTHKDLIALNEDMTVFRDAGCRLIEPGYSSSNLLMQKSSGHLIIVPSPTSQLGFDFSEKYRTSKTSPFPIIRQLPYTQCVGLSVHISHRDYFIFSTIQESEMEGSIARTVKSYYEINNRWLKNLGVLLKDDELVQ